MPGVEAIDRVIGQVYECVIEPAGWDRLLTSCAQLVGGDSALLYVKRRAGGAKGIRTSLGFDPGYDVARYSSYYEARSPLIPRYRNQAEGQVGALGDYAFSADYRETEFFQDWIRPQRFADMLGAHLVRAPQFYAWLSIRRAEERGIYLDSEIRAANRLAPHLGRAIKLGAELERQRGLTESALQSLEMVGVGVLIVDADARLIIANCAAEAILKTGDGLKSRAGRLICERPQESAALQAAIRAVAGVPGSGSSVTTDLRVSRNPAESALTVHVLPIAAIPTRSGLAPTAAAAAVFVIDPLDRLADVDRFATAHGLTTAERRVLREIVRCGGMVNAARNLGLAVPTARTHLQHIFEKTNTGNQAELVGRVMMGPARPPTETRR